MGSTVGRSPAMTLASSLRRVRRRLYSARRFVVIRTPLGGPPVADHIGDVVFRRADSIDLDRLDTLETYGRGSTQRAYVTKGHDTLFVACHGDRIVATRRCSPEIRDPLAAKVVELGAGQIWGADIFCLPEYRSAGLGSRLVLFADRQLASQRYTEVLAAVEADNIASLRLSLRKGSQFAYYVSYFRLLRYERLRVHEELPRCLQARLK